MPLLPPEQITEHFFREEPREKAPTKTLKIEKKTVRRGRGRSKNSKCTNLTIIGNNLAGLTGKLKSLKRIIQFFSPAVIMLQETKMKKPGQICLSEFVIFEKLRENNEGAYEGA